MGHFVNNVSRCVTESLEGLALGSFGNLILVRGKNVILINPQKHENQSKVAIICGGGSGHEPAHSSFVNHEMLSAAICGDVFASPSVGAIVDGIRALVSNSEKSSNAILVIIKNYTGDKINFGMACEILSTEGIILKKLIVADDVSLPDIKDRRGVAGTVLVYKIAGALAFQQQNSNSNMQEQLNKIYELAEKVNNNIHSMGCALSSCHRPDGSTIFTLPEGEMEIGVGIHGERGVLRLPMKSSDEIVTILIDKILAAKQQQETENSNCKMMVLLTNNLGSVSGLEMGIVHRKAISYLKDKGYEVCRAYCGTYMTCLDMRGISLTLLTVVDDTFLDLLDVGGADFTKTNWKPDADYSSSSSSIYIDAPRALGNDTNSGIGSNNDTVDRELMSIIEKVCIAGVEAREMLNDLDRECGDGDAGETLTTACKALLSDLQYYSVSDINLSFRRIAGCLTNAVGGTSGPLYAVFFIRAAAAFSSHANSNNREEWESVSTWADAIYNGISGIEDLGGSSRGDKTLLDGLYPVCDVLKNEGNVGMECLVQAAKDGAENTRNLKAQAGRARYVEGKGLGKVDPGAFAVYLLLKALL
ncbi:MAG: DAK2 domain-containing protein [Candidatus Scalindua sp.]|jgi:dihydroxyacetone kinase|nr:DAK2 domain-containing protein [Candidatus Scalindua sp.]MBT5307293.1 DAK2 domain-containing protein [Candidatus Scalindua sp.]MBT6563820.1 DAK2 domain-containing protein [Candidatus Scalindua sp.]MBT7211739.1 DAK2 domain-containing protein [Candidatus Scalindua sp.]MBT7589600.1 DAK2 domain-containing protein [Candidatus Scalindua sp.]